MYMRTDGNNSSIRFNDKKGSFSMKRLIKSRFSISLVVFILLICATSYTSSHLTESNGEQQHAIQNTNAKLQQEIEEKVLHTISGKIEYGAMNTLRIITVEKKIYTFVKNEEVLEVGESGVLIGNPVTLSYYGILDEKANIQDVEVVKIMVQDAIQEILSHEQRAKDILNMMTLEEKVGQMFIVRCPDIDATQKVSNYALGGYILFGKDFKNQSKADVIKHIQSYQEASKIKMLIGVDEEGGLVNRVSQYPIFRSVPFLSPQDLYEEGGWKLLVSDTKEKATLLKSLGINLNLAPVCDVASGPSDYIFARSFGTDANHTAGYVEKVVRTMNEEKIGCTLKHFPGYGNNIDTHTGIAYDRRDYNHFKEKDFIPFIAGINAGAGSVLVAHNIIECIDSDYPASLSSKVHNVLREELNFKGVIMTDDLVMDAIRQYTGDSEAAVLAVKAGNDMLCCTDFEVQIPAVIEAVHNGDLSEESINESVIRILCWKLELGVVE